jgi:hypothetical protein
MHILGLKSLEMFNEPNEKFKTSNSNNQTFFYISKGVRHQRGSIAEHISIMYLQILYNKKITKQIGIIRCKDILYFANVWQDHVKCTIMFFVYTNCRLNAYLKKLIQEL